MTWEQFTALSTALNRCLGGEREPLCCRVHFNARVYGGFWVILEHAINLLMRWAEPNHVKRAYQRRAILEQDAAKKPAEASHPPPEGQQTHQAGG